MRRRHASIAAFAAASVLVMAGCATSGQTAPATDAQDGGDALTPITVGVIPSIDVASIFLGQAEGFFEDEGLDVTLELAQGGAAVVPAVISGEYQFGFSNVTSLLLAANTGIPLQAVAAGPFTAGIEEDAAGLVVPGESSVQSPADLEGLTVAVNALNNFTETITRNAIEQDGGDPSAVDFVEIALPETPAALLGGQVDAAYVGGPSLSRVLAQGARVISYPAAEADSNLMISAYFTSHDYAAENPEIVDAFVRAMSQANDFAQANPDATRDILTEYMQLDEELRATVVLPRFSSEFTEDSFQIQADLALKYGLVSAPIDFGALVP